MRRSVAPTGMPVIERISKSASDTSAFHPGAFAPDNPTVKDVLSGAGGSGPHRALVVVDEGLARARPGFTRLVEAYFAACPGL